MQIVKSNSALIAVDNSFFKFTDSKFNFLQLIQSSQLSVNRNNISTKSIGSDLSNRSQFLNPDVIFDISYFQRNDFWNERMLGFNFINFPNQQISVFDNLLKDLSNNEAFILMSDLNNNDLVNDIKKNGFNENFITIALDSIFLDKYSISYTLNSIALVSCTFSCSNFNISKLLKENNIFKFKNYAKNNTDITSESINAFYDLSREYPYKHLIYSTKYFNITNDIDDEKISGINIQTLLDGAINKFDLSIEMNRNKNYFFESGASVASRKIIPPIKYSLSISGISTGFVEGDIEKIKQNNLFTFIVSVGKENDEDFSYYEMVFENLVIENFSYSLDLQGFLNYNISFSGEISKNSGFRIRSKYTSNILIKQAISSDSKKIYSSDGYNILTF
jgi:hypothetical protein